MSNASYFGFRCGDAPPQPVSGVRLYAGNDCRFYGIDSSGSIINIGQSFEEITVDADYTIGASEDVVSVTGARTITLPATRSKPISIYAVDSTVTLDVSGTASGIIENAASDITAGNVYKLIYRADSGDYFNG